MQQHGKTVDQLLGAVSVLLALAVLIALLGIVNTLALSVFERTRELGLLRAVGMTRRQVRAVVRWESVIVAVLGAVLVAVLGLAFGAALTRGLAGQGLSSLAVPGGRLAAYVLVAALAGVLAAVAPPVGRRRSTCCMRWPRPDRLDGVGAAARHGERPARAWPARAGRHLLPLLHPSASAKASTSDGVILSGVLHGAAISRSVCCTRRGA